MRITVDESFAALVAEPHPSQVVYVGVRSASGAPRVAAVYHLIPTCGRKPEGPPRIRTWLADAERAGMRCCAWCGR